MLPPQSVALYATIWMPYTGIELVKHVSEILDTLSPNVPNRLIALDAKLESGLGGSAVITISEAVTFELTINIDVKHRVNKLILFIDP